MAAFKFSNDNDNVIALTSFEETCQKFNDALEEFKGAAVQIIAELASAIALSADAKGAVSLVDHKGREAGTADGFVLAEPIQTGERRSIVAIFINRDHGLGHIARVGAKTVTVFATDVEDALSIFQYGKISDDEGGSASIIEFLRQHREFLRQYREVMTALK